MREAKIVGGVLHLTVTGGERAIPGVIKAVEKNKCKVLSVGLRGPKLEDVFIRYTGRAIREEEDEAKERMRMRMKLIRR